MLEFLILVATAILVYYWMVRVFTIIEERTTLYLFLIDFARRHPSAMTWVNAIARKYPKEKNTFLAFLNPFDMTHWKNQRDVMIPEDAKGEIFRRLYPKTSSD